MYLAEILNAICGLFVCIAGMVCLYHLGLALFGLARGFGAPKRNSEARHRFAIVIPAYNEEAVLATALRACANLDYPSELFRVFVIADNCSDATSEIARRFRVTCLERHDAENRGKGYALKWAFPQILSDEFDALLVLDADCQLNAVALRCFNEYLSQGHKVLQANNLVANPDDSALCYLLAVANVLENDLFYHPKSALGLSVLLRGTGMVFHCDVLREIPWDASTAVEDTEYSCRLIERGIPVKFVPAARVSSDFPRNYQELTIQRQRWIGGGARIARTDGLQLIGRGVMTANIRMIDAGWTLCIISRPFVLLQLTMTLTLCLWNHWIRPGKGTMGLLALSITFILFHFLYMMAGVGLLGLSCRRIGFLLSSPRLILSYVWLAFNTLILDAGRVWQPAIRRPSNQTMAKQANPK